MELHNERKKLVRKHVLQAQNWITDAIGLTDLHLNRLPENDEMIFTWYLVTNWVADRLDENGEVIARFGGSTWWGRTTYGQAIYADRAILKIARKIEGGH